MSDKKIYKSATLAEGEAFRWIMKSGWKGLCPRCGEGRMFKSWLKITDRCECCGLDYRFASPDDGPAFFSLCIAALPLIAIVVWVEVAFSPPWWVHLLRRRRSWCSARCCRCGRSRAGWSPRSSSTGRRRPARSDCGRNCMGRIGATSISDGAVLVSGVDHRSSFPRRRKCIDAAPAFLVRSGVYGSPPSRG